MMSIMTRNRKLTNSDEEESEGVAQPRICSFCGSEAPLVWVHGHGQCAKCGVNAEECCQGERC